MQNSTKMAKPFDPMVGKQVHSFPQPLVSLA